MQTAAHVSVIVNLRVANGRYDTDTATYIRWCK